MTKPEAIRFLIAANTKLRKERSGWQITGPSCTWVVLTQRIIRNEERIVELSSELAAGAA